MTKPNLFELANLLKDIRTRLRLTQTEFGARTGFVLQTVVRIEKGDKIKSASLRKICEKLNLDVKTRYELFHAWLKMELREDINLFSIEPKTGLAPEKSPTLTRIQSKLSSRPRTEQEMILFMVEHPDTIEWATHMKKLYESVKK